MCPWRVVCTAHYTAVLSCSEFTVTRSARTQTGRNKNCINKWMRRVHCRTLYSLAPWILWTVWTENWATGLSRKIRLLLHCSRQWQNVRAVILFSNQKSSETQLCLCTALDSKESDNIIRNQSFKRRFAKISQSQGRSLVGWEGPYWMDWQDG